MINSESSKDELAASETLKRRRTTRNNLLQKQKEAIAKLIRRNNSLKSNASSCQVVFTDRGGRKDVPDEQGRSVPLPVPPKSPVMLARRRSSTRSSRGSPIKLFFRRLFRRRSKAKFFFTKNQLRRQLSFDVVHSPDKISTYRVKSIELLKLRPTPQRSNSQKAFQVQQPPVLSSLPTRAVARRSALLDTFQGPQREQTQRQAAQKQQQNKENLLPRVSEASLNKDGFGGFEFDYRTTQPPRIPQDTHLETAVTPETQPQPTIPEVKIQDTAAVAAASAASHLPSKRGSVRSARGSSLCRAEYSVNRKASKRGRSTLPIIRRVDLYDSENPADILRSSEPTITGKGSKFDDPHEVEAALEFVGTWSNYLRRAIAVRVVLRQEIQSWEQQEEEDYRKSSSSYDSDSLYSNSTDSSTTSIGCNGSLPDSSAASISRDSITYNRGKKYYRNSSVFSENTNPNIGYGSRYGHQRGLRFDSHSIATEQLKTHSRTSQQHRTNSDSSSVWQTYSSGNESLYCSDKDTTLDVNNNDGAVTSPNDSDSKLEMDPSSIPAEPLLRSRIQRSSAVDLESMARRYSALIDAGTQTKIMPLRTSSDSFASLSKPDRESAWISPRNRLRVISRPLPPLPSQDARSVSAPSGSDEIEASDDVVNETVTPPTARNPRTSRDASDKILKGMYKELDQLQKRSADLTEAVSRDAGSTGEKYKRKSSDSSSRLRRGGHNRRRPRSEILSKRQSLTVDTTWDNYESDGRSTNSDGIIDENIS